MKKILFITCSMFLCLLVTSCGSEGCAIIGTWKVSDVKVESPKFSESIIKMMESEYKVSIYQFNEDGTMSITTSKGSPTTGKYSLDNEGNVLKWSDDEQGIENVLNVSNCSELSVDLTQRMPSDVSQSEIATVTMTIVPQ